MAKIVNVSPFMANAFAVGGIGNQVLDYYQESVERFKSTIDAGTEIGRSFLNYCSENLAKPAIDLFRRAQQKLAKEANLNIIVPIYDVAELGLANDRMKMVVMSHPEMRRLHQRNRCDGYNNMFDMTHSIDGGVFDRINRTIMNNMYQKDEDTGCMYQITHASDMVINNWTYEDQLAGLITHETVGLALEHGIDASSPEGAKL